MAIRYVNEGTLSVRLIFVRIFKGLLFLGHSSMVGTLNVISVL